MFSLKNARLLYFVASLHNRTHRGGGGGGGGGGLGDILRELCQFFNISINLKTEEFSSTKFSFKGIKNFHAYKSYCRHVNTATEYDAEKIKLTNRAVTVLR